ncbi:hypothetical protein B9Z55_025335 [Caenorhabditis nigoni]|uniref:Uncharacterized protein n=1 Tax=Caenorhabditis nigoni TaxID=1611254 RepID=A0A2G5SYK7_9PELO|nr:hypothetical protein B9Z55_025335 [Caenorhabditis nigoni]
MGSFSLFSPSRKRGKQPVCMPCIIATIADFGELKKNNIQNLPGFSQYKSTVHTLDKKDFDRIRGLTAIRLQSQYGLPLEIKREFRVRIWVNGDVPKFYHVGIPKATHFLKIFLADLWLENMQYREYGSSILLETKFEQ